MIRIIIDFAQHQQMKSVEKITAHLFIIVGTVPDYLTIDAQCSAFHIGSTSVY